MPSTITTSLGVIVSNAPCHPRMRLEVVHRPLDRLAVRQRPHMLNDQLGLQRVRMVEVALVPRVQRKLR